MGPYIRVLCPESCLKVLSLLDRVSRPNYLFKSSFHYHGLFFLLDLLNNVLQYQAQGNAVLISNILQRKATFYRIATLQYSDGVTTRDAQSPEIRDALTEEWFQEWKQRVPIKTVLRLVEGLASQVEELCEVE